MRYTPIFADPANLETSEEPAAPDGETAVALLQAVYRNKLVPLPVRMRAASEALPYENPKLSAVGIASITGQEFAVRLDRALARSEAAKPVMIEGRAEPAE